MLNNENIYQREKDVEKTLWHIFLVV